MSSVNEIVDELVAAVDHESIDVVTSVVDVPSGTEHKTDEKPIESISETIKSDVSAVLVHNQAEKSADPPQSEEPKINSDEKKSTNEAIDNSELKESDGPSSAVVKVEENSSILESLQSLGLSADDAKNYLEEGDKEVWEVKVDAEEKQNKESEEKAKEEIKVVLQSLGLSESEIPADEQAEPEQWEKKAEKEKELESSIPARKYWIPNAIRKFFGAKDATL